MALVKPAVFKEIALEKFGTKSVIKQLATNADPVMGVGGRSVGETVSFFRFNDASDDAADYVKGTPVAVGEVDQTTISATVKIKTKGGAVYDMDNEYSLGNQVEEQSTVITKTLERAMEIELVERAKETTVKVALAGALAMTQAELLSGFAKFGDSQDTDEFAGIVINSALINSFYDMPLFVDLTKAGAQATNGIPTNSILGFFRGLPIYISDMGTFDSVNSEAIALIIKKTALKYKQDGLNVASEREEKLFRTDFIGSNKFATANVDTKGVVLLQKTIV